MSHTVTRGSSCNYPFRYFGHKQYLAQAKARKIEPMTSVLASYEFTPVEVLDLDPTYALEALYAEDDDEPSCGCYCRRCVLHDDHGGCLTPWNHNRPTGVFHADSTGGFYA